MRKLAFLLSVASMSTIAHATAPELVGDPGMDDSSHWMNMSTHGTFAVTGGEIVATNVSAMGMLMENGPPKYKKGHVYHYDYDVRNYVSGMVRLTIGSDNMMVAPPPFVPRIAPTLNGLPDIDEAWPVDAGTVPDPTPTGSMGVDPMGAFRIQCVSGPGGAVDPEVKFGLDGGSHFHSFAGGTYVDSKSTHSTLRRYGGSTCGSDQQHPINKSEYWFPGMLSGPDTAVVPLYWQIYYKRQPENSPACDPASPDYVAGPGGGCINLPTALQFVTGYNFATGLEGPFDDVAGGPHIIKFNCGDALTGNFIAGSNHLSDLSGGVCPIGSLVNVQFTASDCWDGVHLDSPDHRSHIINPNVVSHDHNGDGFFACPASHPWKILNVQMTPFFVADKNLVDNKWHLSSDEMVVGATGTPGKTAHMDYMEGWRRAARDAFYQNCINGHLSCSSGALGNGRMILGLNGKPATPKTNVYTPLSTIGYSKAALANGHYSGEFTAPANGHLNLMGVDDYSGQPLNARIDNVHIYEVPARKKGPATAPILGGMASNAGLAGVAPIDFDLGRTMAGL